MSLKSLIPLPARSGLKWLGAAAADLRDPVAGPRVPARRHTTIGGGDFKAMGEGLLARLRELGLRADMDVLDIGCGQGRVARPMADWLAGDYLGVDVDATAIAWYRARYAGEARFAFAHIDMPNTRYNPGGADPAQAFPTPGASRDFAFAFSVLSHTRTDALRHILAETRRVLRPGGRLVATAFLLDGRPDPDLNFAHAVDAHSRTTVARLPEAAIAFDRAFLEDAVRGAGFRLEVREGQWTSEGAGQGAGASGEYQDLLIADST